MRPRERVAAVLYYLLAVPLRIAGIVLEFLADGVQWLALRAWDAADRWLVRCRLWSGLDERGRTPEQVAAVEAKRQATIAELRAGVESLRGGGA